MSDCKGFERAAKLESVIFKKKPSSAGERNLIGKKHGRRNVQAWHFLRGPVDQTDENRCRWMASFEAIDKGHDTGATVAGTDSQQTGMSRIWMHHRNPSRRFCHKRVRLCLAK